MSLNSGCEKWTRLQHLIRSITLSTDQIVTICDRDSTSGQYYIQIQGFLLWLV